MATNVKASTGIALSPEQGLSRYLTEIRKFPMLEKNEEFMLARRWLEHDDKAAAEKMVTSHLRLVAKIAMGYRGYGLPMAEVISEGNVGLIAICEEVRPGKRLPPRDLCDVVDPGRNPGIYFALVEPCEAGHYGVSEETNLQSAPPEGRNEGDE